MQTTNNKSEIARINKMAVGCHTAEGVIISAAYMLEWGNGNRTIGYVLSVIVLALLPAFIEIVVYRRNQESKAIKYMVMGFFGVFYIFVLLTTTTSLTFTYALPMFIILALFSDSVLSTVWGVGCVAVNLLSIIIRHPNGFVEQELAAAEIQVLVLAIVAVYVVLTSRVVKINNNEKLDTLNHEKEAITLLLSEIMEISTAMTEDIRDMSRQMKSLESSVSETKEAMAEVSSGTTDTAESIQGQLVRTEEIQKHIQNVQEAAQDIQRSMETTEQEVVSGKQNIDILLDQAKAAEEASTELILHLNELNEQTVKMQSIIELITGVASQTSLLALNANIEAARAGAAGRGFAVVASEISSLSNQTQSATVNITELINEVSSKLEVVADGINSMVENNKKQNGYAVAATESFEKITQSEKLAIERSFGLESVIAELKSANDGIVDSIQTVSAIMEEVSAHATETFNSCDQNAIIVRNVETLAEQLNKDAKILLEKK